MARRTFGRFPGPDDGERVPDGTTIRRLPEAPVRTGAVEKPFARSDAHPGDAGYPAMGGQTVDATIVAAPCQRMTDAGKEIVRGGGIPADWQANPRKPAQKDRDARWTLGRGRGKTRPDGTAMVATDVTRPFPVRLIGMEIAFQQIGCDAEGVITVGCHPVFP